jgi:hypothetical protein
LAWLSEGQEQLPGGPLQELFAGGLF